MKRLGALLRGSRAPPSHINICHLCACLASRRVERELDAHDELVLEAPQDDVERLSAMVREEMEGVAELKVPLVVDAASGKDWYEAKA